MSAHLLGEFHCRVNVTDSNSAYNEAVHKAVKATYKLTNRKRNQFIQQLVLSEHVYTLMHNGEESSTEEEKAPRIDTDSVGYDSEGTWSSGPLMRKRRQRQQRRRRWDSKKYSVATVLCRSESTLFCKNGNMYYGNASLPMKGRTQYTIRGARVFHGSPWLDWMRYRGPDGALRVGQAAFVITNRARGWEQLVVQRVQKTRARPGCVLT